MDHLGLSLFLVFAFFATQSQVIVEACEDETATNSWNNIESHDNYNGWRPYANDYEECWIITTSSANKIIYLTTVDFDLELGDYACEYDVLRIHDSDSPDHGNSVDKCGYGNFEIYSSGRYLYLNFSTDSSVRYAGFEIKFKQVDASEYDASMWIDTRPTHSWWHYSTYPTPYTGSPTPQPSTTPRQITPYLTPDTHPHHHYTFAQIVGIIFAVILGVIIMITIVCVGCIICITHANKQGRIIDPNRQVAYIHSSQRAGLEPNVAYNPANYTNQPPPLYASQPSLQQHGPQSYGQTAGAVAPAITSINWERADLGVTDAHGNNVDNLYNNYKPPVE